MSMNVSVKFLHFSDASQFMESSSFSWWHLNDLLFHRCMLASRLGCPSVCFCFLHCVLTAQHEELRTVIERKGDDAGSGPRGSVVLHSDELVILEC